MQNILPPIYPALFSNQQHCITVRHSVAFLGAKIGWSSLQPKPTRLWQFVTLTDRFYNLTTDYEIYFDISSKRLNRSRFTRLLGERT
jgi:hypothetical protein